MNLCNPYVEEDSADGSFEALLPYFKYVNEHIGITSAQAGILCADVALVFNGPDSNEDPAAKGLIAFDGLHPNDSGHKAMADLLRSLGYQPLATAGTGVPCRTDLGSGRDHAAGL